MRAQVTVVAVRGYLDGHMFEIGTWGNLKEIREHGKQ